MSFISEKKANAVNIITWYDYLTKDIVNDLEKKCNTKISYDEYYTIDEFLMRFNEQSYSIAIFPQSAYNLVSKKIENKGISIESIKKSYYSGVYNSGFNKDLPNNVGVFGIDAAGFLYNPDFITIKQNSTLKDIFSQTKGKKVIILDNPIEPMKLVSSLDETIELKEAVNRFRELFEGTEVMSTNDIANFSNDPNIVLVHSWIGSAYRHIKINPKFKFTHHPMVSYIGADLIASMNKNTDTECVVKVLAGKDMNTKIISEDFVMSPFGILEPEKFSINNQLYFELNNNFFKNQYNKLRWHGRPNIEEYQKNMDLWQRIKISIKN